jgi:hypothetical protein
MEYMLNCLVFRKYDNDGNGTLTRLEFTRATRDLGLKLTLDEVCDLFNHLDPGNRFCDGTYHYPNSDRLKYVKFADILLQLANRQVSLIVFFYGWFLSCIFLCCPVLSFVFRLLPPPPPSPAPIYVSKSEVRMGYLTYRTQTLRLQRRAKAQRLRRAGVRNQAQPQGEAEVNPNSNPNALTLPNTYLYP